MDPSNVSQLLLRDSLASVSETLEKDDSVLLVVDTRSCPHSKRLMEEVQVNTAIHSTASKRPKQATTLIVLDTCDMHGLLSEVRVDTWLPGVPCLIAQGRIHLGVDVFRRCREIVRSARGAVLHRYTNE